MTLAVRPCAPGAEDQNMTQPVALTLNLTLVT